MAKRQQIDVSAESKAPPERVWALVVDVNTWSDWGPWNETVIQVPGPTEEQGVGAIRRMQRTGSKSIERVVSLDPPKRFGYELVSGLPINDYRAEVTLEPTASGGTTIRWQSSFEGKVPGQGALIRMILGRFIQSVVIRLARAAEAS